MIKSIGGKRVLLVGSGPTADFINIGPFDVIVTANAAAGALLKHGLNPEVTFVTSHLLSNKIEEETWRALSKIMSTVNNPKILVSIRNGFHFERVANLARFGMHPRQLGIVKLGEMRRIAVRLTKSKLVGAAPGGLPSTGMLALILCFFFGAKSVELTGFELTIPPSSTGGSNHYYDEQEPWSNDPRIMRSHSSADLLILSSLAIRGHKISSDSLEIQTALKNWGYQGQNFYNPTIWSKIFWSRNAPW
jgi:hypothetical protein